MRRYHRPKDRQVNKVDLQDFFSDHTEKKARKSELYENFEQMLKLAIKEPVLDPEPTQRRILTLELKLEYFYPN